MAIDRDLAAIDEAMAALRESHPDLGRIVECHLFGGMGLDAMAEILGLPPRSARKMWAEARARLIKTLESGSGG